MTDSPQQEQQEFLQKQQELSQELPAQGKLQQTFKCANCAAKMEFQPGADAQKCPYCGHENPIPKSEEDIRELDFSTFLAELSDEDMLERLTIKCPECAAETTAQANVTSHECPFCGSNIVATASSSKQLKPRSLLPFKVTRAEGWKSFRVWISRLWFAPKGL